MPSPSFLVNSSLYGWAQRRAFAAKLSNLDGPRPLLRAIENAASNTLTDDERRAIAGIGEVSRALQRSHEVIDINDYGARSSKQQHSMEEFAQGVVKRRAISNICRNVLKNQLWHHLLFHLIRQFKPTSCVEMGTCLGVSAAYISSALKLNGAGRLVTLDGSPQQAEIARANFQRLGLDNVTVRVGRFSDTLEPVLEEMDPVSFVFVDGHHDEGATRLYFDTIRQYLDAANLIILDDIRWSEGMKSAWQYVASQCEAYDLGRVGACINVGAVGRETVELGVHSSA